MEATTHFSTRNANKKWWLLLIGIALWLVIRSLTTNNTVLTTATATATTTYDKATINKTLATVLADLLEVSPDTAFAFLEDDDLWDAHEDIVVAFIETILENEGHPFNDMDFSKGEAATCGLNKCLYNSISNQSNAYLVARRQNREAELFATGQSYETELGLVERFGIPQLSLERPYSIDVSTNMERLLLAVDHFYKQRPLDKLVVQNVKKAPTPHLDVHKTKSLAKPLPAFRKKLLQLNSRDNTTITKFRQQFQRERERLYKMINTDPQLLWLIFDFQFVLTNDGKWYHVDLDRGGPLHSPQLVFPNATALQNMQTNINATLDSILFWLTEATDKDFKNNYPETWCVATYRCDFKQDPTRLWEHCRIKCSS